MTALAFMARRPAAMGSCVYHMLKGRTFCGAGPVVLRLNEAWMNMAMKRMFIGR